MAQQRGSTERAAKIIAAYPGPVTLQPSSRKWLVMLATSVAFAVPHTGNRLVVTRNGRVTEEILGDQTSYTYQLARLAEDLRTGRPFPSGIDGAVANAGLIDECYRRAGLSARGSMPR